MNIVPFHMSIGGNAVSGLTLYVSTPDAELAIPILIDDEIVQAGARLLLPEHVEYMADVSVVSRELGAIIYPDIVRDLLTRSAREAQAQDDRLQIQIQIAVPELAALPWEWAVVDGARTWAPAINEDYSVVRVSSVAEPAPPILVDGALQVLLCVPPKHSSHYRSIYTLLSKEIASQRIAVTIIEVQDIHDIEQALSRQIVHIVHLVGDVRLSHEHTVNIHFGEPIDVFELNDVLMQFPNIGLISVTAQSDDDPEIRAMPQIFAALLMSETINAAITFSGVCSADAIIRFAATCYNALIDDLPVDLAVVRGRRALVSGRAQDHWGLPQLRIVPSTEQLFVFDTRLDPWRWVRSVVAVIGIAAALLGAIMLGRFLTAQPVMPDTPPAIVMPTDGAQP
jgi:hypothetical protein